MGEPRGGVRWWGGGGGDQIEDDVCRAHGRMSLQRAVGRQQQHMLKVSLAEKLFRNGVVPSHDPQRRLCAPFWHVPQRLHRPASH